MKHGDRCFGFGFEKANNLMHLVAEKVIAKGVNTTYTVLVDLSRSQGREASMGDIWEAVEKIKNGDITSGKYGGNDVQFQCPHVWVFTNKMPDLSALSRDRWAIWEIYEEQLWSREGVRLEVDAPPPDPLLAAVLPSEVSDESDEKFQAALAALELPEWSSRQEVPADERPATPESPRWDYWNRDMPDLEIDQDYYDNLRYEDEERHARAEGRFWVEE